MKQVRCAIYTRKSSEEGLEQDFNSLDAQREACAAYVLSQASEGWKLIEESYDDGGLSGGTLERPALQRLLGDVKDGRVDIIVVYKVDRLTRSLLDFAKLVETFDASDTSFVSVTQSFNTTTSMGRLTLNMLLSFAQFEREVTAERIRDKIAASKAKGMWMGGTSPLGYKPDGRSLAIVEEHAALIREIFDRYLALGTVRLVADSLVSDGITTPRRVNGKGRGFGGVAFTRGQLYAILGNPVYAGDIAHKGKVYPGNHSAIIERAMWDTVQARLADNVQGQRTARRESLSLLAGLLHDAEGEPLVAVHTRKGQQRYRYYVSRGHHHGTTAPGSPSLRLPAREIEQAVRQELASLLADPVLLTGRLGLALTPELVGPVLQHGEALRERMARADPLLVQDLVAAITVHPDRIVLMLKPDGFAAALGIGGPALPQTPVTHEVPVRLTRTGRAIRLVQEDGRAATGAAPDPALLRLLVTARRWWDELAQGQCDIAALARRENVSASWMTRVVRLAFLSPSVTEAILAGRTRAGTDAAALLATGAVAIDWREQQLCWLPVSGA